MCSSAPIRRIKTCLSRNVIYKLCTANIIIVAIESKPMSNHQQKVHIPEATSKDEEPTSMMDVMPIKSTNRAIISWWAWNFSIRMADQFTTHKKGKNCDSSWIARNSFIQIWNIKSVINISSLFIFWENKQENLFERKKYTSGRCDQYQLNEDIENVFSKVYKLEQMHPFPSVIMCSNVFFFSPF